MSLTGSLVKARQDHHWKFQTFGLVDRQNTDRLQGFLRPRALRFLRLLRSDVPDRFPGEGPAGSPLEIPDLWPCGASEHGPPPGIPPPARSPLPPAAPIGCP